MKFKKVMLICILLAILTMGAASAEDALNDTATQNPEDGQALVEDTDYSVHVPAEYMDSTYYGSDVAGVENMPCDAEGNISITVDDMERYNRKVVSGPNAISLGELDLDYGNHSIAIKYTGDGKYRGFLKNSTFERVYLGVECPKEFTIASGQYTLDVSLAKGVTGNVNILIDGKSVYSKKYDAANPPSISLNKYIGYHTYEVRYSEGNKDDLIKRGTFNASIFDEPYFYPDVITYGDSVRFEMDLPLGSKVARVNKNVTELKAYDGYTYVTINDFVVGKNVVEFTVNYNGASQTRNCTVIVAPKITLPDVLVVDRKYNFTFLASEDFNGNLTLSGIINDNVPVTNGTAKILIPNQTAAGNYTLNISYENYTWSYDVHVLENAPEVIIYINYYDEIHPWNSWYDDDPDHYDFLYYVSVWTYPSYALTGNTEIYLDGKLEGNLTGNVDKFHLWPDYYNFTTHTIEVRYLGDDTFGPKNETFTYTVSPYECYVDQYSNVWVTVDEGVSGNLTIKVDGNKQYIEKIKKSDYYESYYYPLKNLTKDKNFTIDVSFKAKPAKYSFSKTLNFTLTCPIEFSGGDIIYGYEDSVIFYAPKDLEDNVTVLINGSQHNYTEYDGEYNYWIDEATQIAYKVNISDLGPGFYNVTIKYTGDKKYPSASVNDTINITAKIEWIDEWEDDVYTKVSICLPANASGNLTMEIKYDGESNYTLFKTVELKNGTAEIILPMGKYHYRVYYSGDDYQVDEWDYFEVSYPSVSYKGWMNYGQNYKFKVNDDVNGTLIFYLGWDTGARLPVAWFDLTQGKTVSVDKKLIDEALAHNMAKLIMNHNYANDGYYSLDLHPVICSDIGTFDFDPIYIDFAYKITGASNVNMYYTASKTLSLKVYNLYGKLVGKNQVVKIKIGKKTYQAKTNSKGVAKFKIPTTITPGKYTMTISYKNKKVTKKLTVKQILSVKTVKVKKSAKKLVLTATLKKVNGKYIKNKRVTFKFNGKTYKAKTNKKGVAKYTIKKSVLKKLKVGKKIKYQATYLKTTVKKTAKVKR